MRRLSRRAFVGGSIATTTAWSIASGVGGSGPASGAVLGRGEHRRGPVTQPEIRPREEWAQGRVATGPLEVEAPGDVRFLLVHHTETPNGYLPSKVIPRLQNIFQYHTGQKGWPDIAYNFFVDAQGRIWEGRTGSLDAPVKGDATGGSQGFALLCCFVGDHQVQPPTPAAITSMSALAAWLAGRYEINLHAGHAITFTSRGSNRWPAGTIVTTDPIAGHRDMSKTACPGDAAYPLVRGVILAGAQALAPEPATTTTARPPTTTAPPTSTIGAPEPTTATVPTTAPSEPPEDATSDGGGERTGMAIAGAAGVALVAGGSAWAWQRRSRRDDGAAVETDPDPIP